MKVLFVCSQGMSSAIAVNALKKEAEKNGVNMEVNAVSTSFRLFKGVCRCS